MPEEARKKRYEWLDVLKFMGMLEIYIAHMGTVSGKLLPLMFVFNVQLFFFMSGLFYRPPQKGQLRGYLVDKVCGILVPYFLFSFIIMGLSYPSRFRAFQIQGLRQLYLHRPPQRHGGQRALVLELLLRRRRALHAGDGARPQ